MSTLLLDKNATSNLLDMAGVMKAVEEAFISWVEGKASMPPKSYLLVEKGDFRAMPAAIPGAAGIKWVNVHTHNAARGLPTVIGVYILSDPETAYPLAIMDATEITAYRTAATAAIAARYLAKKESHTMGIIGAGKQARYQVLAHAEVFDIRQINVADISEAAMDGLIRSLPGFTIKKCSAEMAVSSDIVCTLTPSRSPVVRREWIKPGTHINAVGADAPGKQELEPAVLSDAKVIVDDLRQARSAGEINVPITSGLYKATDIYANLGEIITGKKPGRTDGEAITVFDSTGVAIEDVA
ncbi:MAG TPA: ornithine cyclodeaminase family protein, partial [Dehalococcoidia bacterium]|nr:ornithine cyclodeaminase family protein [Dehalococcoidia bacterium]